MPTAHFLHVYLSYFTNPASWLPHWNKRLSCLVLSCRSSIWWQWCLLHVRRDACEPTLSMRGSGGRQVGQAAGRAALLSARTQQCGAERASPVCCCLLAVTGDSRYVSRWRPCATTVRSTGAAASAPARSLNLPWPSLLIQWRGRRRQWRSNALIGKKLKHAR